MWRSLVAHSAGGRVVGGSNPLIPTISLVLNKIQGVVLEGSGEIVEIF